MANDETVAHYELAHKTMSEAEDYIRRGRHLRSLSLSDLRFEFVSSIQLVIRDGNDSALRLAMHDTLAEFDLRGEEPPYHLVRTEMMLMAERGKARLEAFSDEDRQRIEEGIQERYANSTKQQH